MYLGSYLPLPPYRLGRGVDSKRLVHTHTHTHPILASGPGGLGESRPCPHPHNAHPNSGRRCFPIGRWFLALGPEPLFRRVVALLFAPSPLAGWLARSNIGAFSQKFGVGGVILLSLLNGAAVDPPGVAGATQIAPQTLRSGGPGPRTKGRGQQGRRVSRMGAALLGDTARGRGGVQASRVLCGSSATSFTGSPWPVGTHIPGRPPGTRRSGPPGHSAHPTCAHVVVCSLVRCKVTYGLSCTQHTQPLLLQFRRQHQDAHKSRICVPAGIV